MFDYFNTLKKFIKKGCNFSILHLNIKSLYSKLDELDNILQLGYDIVTLNETKLDSLVPHSFYSNSKYNILRLDRNRHGGGIIIFLRSEYEYITSPLTDIEAIYFRIKFKNLFYNFICTYKPPLTKDKLYLDNLSHFIDTLDSSLPLFIIGDLNMDLKTNKGFALRNFMLEFSLNNHVNEFTRAATSWYNKKSKYVTSKSLIDVILHNGNLINITQTIDCPFSDHKFVVAGLNFAPSKSVIVHKKIRNLSSLNLSIINVNLSKLNIFYDYNGYSINQVWEHLKSNMIALTNTFAPFKSVAINYRSKFPWSDKELFDLKKKRDIHYHLYKLYNDIDYLEQFKNIRALYQSQKRIKMTNYFKSKSKISDFKNSKSYWKFYSASIATKSDKSSDNLISLNVNNKLITNPKQISDSFNTFFTTLDSSSTHSLAQSITEIDLNYNQLISDGLIRPSIFKFQCTTLSIVSKLITKLDDNSSPGVVGIPTKVMSHSTDFALLATKLINHCILTSTIPEDWKAAVVTPLYKNKGDNHDINNYRGISIISPIAKVFEKVLATQIIDYLNNNNILCLDQHGFRSEHSCETALHELLTDLNKARDNSLTSLLLFIDFRKAFDLVNSNLLLRKLFHLGFDRNALALIKNYFNGRFQQVNYNGELSDKKEIKLGVPQGSVLGPLFFTIFINDLPLLMDELKTFRL